MSGEDRIVPEPAIIMVLEAEVSRRDTLCNVLRQAGYAVIGLGNESQTLEVLKNRPFNVIIADTELINIGGLNVIDLAREINPDVAVIMRTKHSSIESMMKFVNEEAYTYLAEPVTLEELKITITNALHYQRLSRENKRLVDDLQLSNKLLSEANRQLTAASEAKSAFLAHMSHELRTPLNAIIGFSELLLDCIPGEINEEQKQCLNDIFFSGKHLLGLINDVLDLSRVEAGKIELRPENLNLTDVINDVAATVRPLLGDKRHELTIAIEPDLPQICTDRSRLRQILLNLLGNAIKFTPPGGKLDIEAARQNLLFCRISVVDNGDGIKPEDQKRIFEAFAQLDTPDQKADGTGLGLTLTRQLVELAGGRIWLESEYGEGSRFTFTIPLAEKGGDNYGREKDRQRSANAEARGALRERRAPAYRGAAATK